jgi:hypothetical protein
LIAALNSVGGWPIIGNASTFKNSSYDWRDVWAKIIGQLGYSFIYSISVLPDANDTFVNRVYVRIPFIIKY